ncbi:thioesterase family protein [Terrabacter terrae]|uniref:Thioesterase family protein n=2 Tax=Terrabacter terrae TaxID=318434 RepID=A0ABN2TXX9_9MICO
MSETTDAIGTPQEVGDAKSGRYAAHVSLRWSDMDAYAHINNVQFLRLLEDARVIAFRDWFDGGGAGDKSLLDEGVLVSRHEIEYRRPLGFRHAPVEIQMWVSRVGGAGFDVAYIVTDPDGVGDDLAGADRPVYAVAETELALYDFASASPRRMRPEERASLRAHVGEPAPFRRRRR